MYLFRPQVFGRGEERKIMSFLKSFLKSGGRRRLALVCAILIPLCCAALPTAVSSTVNGNNGDTVTISKEEYERLSQFEELAELMDIVKSYYYVEPDTESMLSMAATGLLAGLDDPYTFYYTPEAFAEMWADDEGDYAGVGMQITANYKTNICTISRVFLNSPALEAGIRKGDILVQVEDITVNAYNLQDAVNIMRGEPGKPVHIQMMRGEELLDFDVVRAQVHVNWVNSCMLPGQIGYISLYEFSGDCAPTFKEHLDNLTEQGARALVLDLRDNPGGWVTDAQAIADLFLDDGTLASLKYVDGSTEYYRTTTDGSENTLPLVVIVNENSASSSEILSGALQDRDRAEILGVQSYGKGIVQCVLDVGTKGAGMQLTIAQYFTPEGHEVHKIGITPDVISEMPEDKANVMYELGDLEDPQLNDAYQLALSMVK